MDTKTGDIYEINSKQELEAIEERLGRRLLPLSQEQYKTLKPLSKRRRKFLLKNGTCPCGSRKSFKKCCAKKYQ